MVKIRHLGRAILGLAALFAVSVSPAKAESRTYSVISSIGTAVSNTSLTDFSSSSYYVLRRASDGGTAAGKYLYNDAYTLSSISTGIEDSYNYVVKIGGNATDGFTFQYVSNNKYFALSSSGSASMSEDASSDDIKFTIEAFTGTNESSSGTITTGDTYVAISSKAYGGSGYNSGYGYGFNAASYDWNTSQWVDHFTSWNSNGGQQAAYEIIPVDVTEVSVIDVTYTVKTSDGTTVTDADGNAVSGTYEVSSGEAVIPSALKRDYCSYTYSPTTIDASTTEVTATVTYNLPFTPSTSLTEGTAKWYRLGIRPKVGKYITYDASSTLFHDYETTDLSDNPTTAELFAFTGDPYSGFQIYNCAAGIDKNLGVDNSTQIYSGMNYAVLPITTETKWRMYEGSNGTYTGAYFKLEGTDTSYMHDSWTWDTNSNSFTSYWTYKLGIWNNAGASSDQGSYISFTAVDLVDVPLTTISGAGYATAYMPFSVSSVSGATAYVGAQYKEDDATVLQMEEATGVAASNGFVLVGDADATATLTIGDASTTSNVLTGTLSILDITDNQSNYLVFGQGSTSGAAGFFKPATSITSIPSNKAYINNTGSNAIRLDFGGDVTGIDAATLINGEQNNAPVYDLSGRRVTKVTRGLYIQGGKKYIAR